MASDVRESLCPPDGTACAVCGAGIDPERRFYVRVAPDGETYLCSASCVAELAGLESD
ncbi:MAG: hypothetical protein ABEJ70_02975 [Halobacteriaceae archaeon]